MSDEPRRPTTADRDAWNAYWTAQEMPWRTEPEIDEQRQRFLAERRAFAPDSTGDMYPFRDEQGSIKLDRADVEWLLATNERDGMRGPVAWSDPTQRQREGPNLSAADLREAHLDSLPLARAVLVVAQLQRATLENGQLQGASLESASLCGANLTHTQLQEAVLDGADLQDACLREAQLAGASLLNAHLQGALFYDTDLRGARLTSSQAQRAFFLSAQLQEAQLGSADLEGASFGNADLQGAHLDGAKLHGAFLGSAQLQGASLHHAHLQGAFLMLAHLQGAHLTDADLQGTRLVGAGLQGAWLSGARLDGSTDLADIELDGETRLADVAWHDAPLMHIPWHHVARLGDESEARRRADADGAPKDQQTRLAEFTLAVRAYRQLALVLRAQGLNEHADRFAYRAHVLQRAVLRWQGQLGRAFGSWLLAVLTGYGYKPLRSLIAYVVILCLFAGAYLLNAQFAPPHLTWDEALVLSISSFHGHGFFLTGIRLSDLLARLAAGEAIIGLLLEITCIATFTHRFFAR